MPKAILDTNLFIDWFNRQEREDLVLSTDQHLCAIVWMELATGAKTPRARREVVRLVGRYHSLGRIVAPLPNAFDRAGRALNLLRAAGREISRASFVNDLLIAETARAIGATVYTRDRDFEDIRKVEDFSLELVQ